MTVGLMLEELLDREWEAQNRRAAPLEPTATVRELLELALALTPGGIFAAAALTEGRSSTPRELVSELREALPGELSPWTLRAMHQVAALRFPQPVLPAAHSPLMLEPAPPQVAVLSEPKAELAPAVDPVPLPVARSRPARRSTTLAAGALLGAGIGALASVASAPGLVTGAAAGLTAAALGLVIGKRAR